MATHGVNVERHRLIDAMLTSFKTVNSVENAETRDWIIRVFRPDCVGMGVTDVRDRVLYHWLVVTIKEKHADPGMALLTRVKNDALLSPNSSWDGTCVIA